eukprot:5977301-Prymnesium_polylepis.1
METDSHSAGQSRRHTALVRDQLRCQRRRFDARPMCVLAGGQPAKIIDGIRAGRRVWREVSREASE